MLLKIIFWLLIYHGLNAKTSFDPKIQLKRVIEASIKLEEVRLEITKKNIEGIRRKIGYGQARAAKTVLDNEETDIRAHVDKIAGLKKILNLADKGPIRPADIDPLLNDGKCKLNDCLKILGLMNIGLMNVLSEINTQVIVQEWNKIEFATKPKTDEAFLEAEYDNISQQIDLITRNYACQRSIGTWTGQVEINAALMGRCFSDLAVETAKELNTKQSLVSSSQHFERPYDDFLSDSDEDSKKLAEFVESNPDFQVTPWKLFRYCLIKSNANLVQAAHLCYEGLRKNRSRSNFQRKLFDIRGDRSKGGDNSGDWYHFFGTMRLSLAYGGRLTKGLYHIVPDLALGAEAVSANIQVGSEFLERRNDLLGIETGTSAEYFTKQSLFRRNWTADSKKSCGFHIFSFHK